MNWPQTGAQQAESLPGGLTTMKPKFPKPVSYTRALKVLYMREDPLGKTFSRKNGTRRGKRNGVNHEFE
jgi:hypothetical protein